VESEVDHLDAEASLAELIREGDRAAEKELVTRFHRRVLLMAWARTHDPEAAADLAQDTMLAVLQAVRNGKLIDADRLPGFVRGTAKNLINNHLRGQRPARRREVDSFAQLGPDPEELAGDTERMDQVRRALAELGPADRMVLLLTLIEGLRPREIAARLGLSSEVVRKRKSRAVARLREAVERRSRS
jgi:RNA polymerase sigma-70 factor (ECF subfamily)